MYTEYNPHPLLKPYIDKYWVSQGYINGTISMKILPDGCIDIIFAYGESASTRCMTENTPYIVGTATTFTEQQFSNTVDMFGVRFNPAGITAFVKAQFYEVTDRIVELSQVDSLFNREFYLSIPDTHNRLTQIKYIENYLLKTLSYAFETDTRMVHAVNLFNHHTGNISPIIVAEKVCLSSRQFERKFKSVIGISPKMYNRIRRLKHTKQFINTFPDKSLSEIAWDCGYYDHSHLIKDFTGLTGELPSYFLK